MPFPPYEALHFVHCGLPRTAAPMEQMICSSCCWHLFGRFLGRRPYVKHTHVSTMIITTVFCIASECNTNKAKDYSDAFYKIRFFTWLLSQPSHHLSCKQVYLLTTGTDWQGRGFIKTITQSLFDEPKIGRASCRERVCLSV